MPGSYAIYGPAGIAGYVDQNPLTVLLANVLISVNRQCFGGIQSNQGSGLTIIGDIFLKSQFVVYDRTVPRVGFAQQKGVTV